MSKKGFVEAAYDDKLALWKPKKMKRTLVPAPQMSFAEIHYQLAAQAEADAEVDAEEAESAPVKPDRPTTKLTAQPVIVKGGKRHFFGAGQRLPQFMQSKVEDFATQNQKAGRFQIAEVRSPEYFKPRPSSKPRFAEVAEEETDNADEEEEEVVAADSIELSPLPSASLPDAQSDEAVEAAADATTEAQLTAQDVEIAASIQSETESDPAAKSFIQLFARKH